MDQTEKDIFFVVDGEGFSVSGEAVENGQIVLPDGRFYRVDEWDLGGSPRPKRLREVLLNFKGTPMELANKYEAILATEVKHHISLEDVMNAVHDLENYLLNPGLDWECGKTQGVRVRDFLNQLYPGY